MSLADRLNRIIEEQKLSKAEFSRRIGVSVNYIYLLTGNSKNRPESIAASLAMLIALEFGYDAEWILHGETGKESFQEKCVTEEINSLMGWEKKVETKGSACAFNQQDNA